MPGTCAFDSPCWYQLATDAIAIGSSTSTVCHQGAMGSLAVSADVITPLDDIVRSSRLFSKLLVLGTGFSTDLHDQNSAMAVSALFFREALL